MGGALLSLPMAAADGRTVSVLDAFFTSVSAVCLTGLIVVDTPVDLSLFGQVVVMLLDAGRRPRLHDAQHGVCRGARALGVAAGAADAAGGAERPGHGRARAVRRHGAEAHAGVRARRGAHAGGCGGGRRWAWATRRGTGSSTPCRRSTTPASRCGAQPDVVARRRRGQPGHDHTHHRRRAWASTSGPSSSACVRDVCACRCTPGSCCWPPACCSSAARRRCWCSSGTTPRTLGPLSVPTSCWRRGSSRSPPARPVSTPSTSAP